MLISRPAQTVVVRAGDTVDSLGAQYGSNAAAINWANDLVAGATLVPGNSVVIPPGAGALVQVRPGEKPTAFATRLHLDPRVVLDYNALASDSPLAAGTYLQVPLGAAPVGALLADKFIVAAPGIPGVSDDHGGNGFPFGQCTWYVASRRDVTWGGNAGSWWWNAAGRRPEGHVPVMGAIVVFRGGWTGHVGYVEQANTDGSFVISEMNYGWGWGRVDRRLIAANDRAIIGFIY
jgi:LysM repeat protein